MGQEVYKDWSSQHNEFNRRMRELDVKPSISISDKKGIAILAHASFNEFEGEFSKSSPTLMINLCTANIARFKRFGDGPSLEGIIRPGSSMIALPETSGQGYSSQTEMLGIAINLDNFNHFTDNAYTKDSFVPAASKIHNDVYISSMMNALWRDAEMHGLSSLFFEQGTSLVLDYLSNMKHKLPLKKSTRPLNRKDLQKVYEFIESRVTSDISISELASVTGQNMRSFTQSFSMATGYTPYVYFTLRRIEYAKTLLREKTLNITDIAMAIGYANPSKFSAAFKKVVGVSPKAWQKTK